MGDMHALAWFNGRGWLRADGKMQFNEVNSVHAIGMSWANWDDFGQGSYLFPLLADILAQF